ncbi:MAG: hypothetical protein U1E02_14865 [Hydrogenophaga sp.]|nr:hypothetical protein [Hydrogenophaga sp.]
MSKASQRKQSRTKPNPLLKINPMDLMVPVYSASESKTIAKLHAQVTGKTMEVAWKRYRTKAGSTFDAQAHADLDEDMMAAGKPIVQAIHFALIDSESGVPDDEFQEDSLPYFSGTAVLVPFDASQPWIVEPMPYLAVQQYRERKDASTHVCELVREWAESHGEFDDGCFAFWFTATTAAWLPFMAAAVHGNGASATYTLVGGEWAKGPPYLLPFEDNAGEMDVLGQHPPEEEDNTALLKRFLKVLSDYLPEDKASQASKSLIDPCIEWNRAISKGLASSQVQLALQLNDANRQAQRYETDMGALRKEHEQAERRLRKSSARVTELEAELARMRGLVAKQGASNQRVTPAGKTPSQPASPLPRRTSMGERLAVFFG